MSKDTIGQIIQVLPQLQREKRWKKYPKIAKGKPYLDPKTNY